jgi:CBS domain containing-hemolysin-like protein
VQEIAPGRYIADAGISVYDLEDYLGVKLHDDGGDYDSLGGMVVELAGHVPAAGESVVSGAFRLIVRDSDPRHVRRVEILRRPDADAAE